MKANLAAGYVSLYLFATLYWKNTAMKTLCSLLLFFISYNGFAQIQDLLSNPDITWIAETELEYDFEPEYLEARGIEETDRDYNYRVRKSDFSYCNYSISVINCIFDGLKDGQFVAYDKMGGKRLSKVEVEQKLFPGVDTTTYIDPVTFEERIKIASCMEPNYNLIESFLVRQVWYYNSKTKNITNRILGISLMIPNYDEKEDAILEEKKVLMYVAFSKVVKKALHINLPHVPFVMETSEYINVDAFKTLKGDLNETFEHLFFQLPKNKAIKAYSTETGRCCNQLINQAEYEEIFNASTDSISVFDAHHYTETIKVAKKPELQFEDYKAYNIMQTWYFDAKSNQLISTLDAAAPCKTVVLDENGNFLYNQILFYLCFLKRH